ncbi:uncharacterized protein L201_001199 [Kwoniella dendrophila CBS 6074]|uniref:Uncharacterized protein n=1 Tax=Kwoniella dendrophila CBS 6074 TaxID=1295534 RepID=A0AAX4JLM5_9TREE
MTSHNQFLAVAETVKAYQSRHNIKTDYQSHPIGLLSAAPAQMPLNKQIQLHAFKSNTKGIPILHQPRNTTAQPSVSGHKRKAETIPLEHLTTPGRPVRAPAVGLKAAVKPNQQTQIHKDAWRSRREKYYKVIPPKRFRRILGESFLSYQAEKITSAIAPNFKDGKEVITTIPKQIPINKGRAERGLAIRNTNSSNITEEEKNVSEDDEIVFIGIKKAKKVEKSLIKTTQYDAINRSLAAQAEDMNHKRSKRTKILRHARMVSRIIANERPIEV